MKTQVWPRVELSRFLEWDYVSETLAELLAAAVTNHRTNLSVDQAWPAVVKRLQSSVSAKTNAQFFTNCDFLPLWLAYAIQNRDFIEARAKGLLQVRAIATLPGMALPSVGAMPEAGTERRRSAAPAPAGA